ncbi:MAG: hypothetical protein BWY94_02472 [Actinobacteria bacterium ADurb.BinA094]|nr:MAG: hypothetical protein BWY94_02472 [Actinobacteria bacterium ADurb.BinA094]
MLVLEDLGALGEHRAGDREHRLRVALAERMQQRQLAHQVLVDRLQVDPGGDVDRAVEFTAGEPLRDRGVEACPKLGDVGAIQGDADGHRVAAPAAEQPVAVAERLHEVDAEDAAAGALRQLALAAEHDAGAVELPRHAAGHDADHAGVPVVVVKHDAVVGRVEFLDLALGVLGDAALDVLALAVEAVELTGSILTEGSVLAEDEFDGERGVGEAAAGVDARTEAEGDVDGLETVGAVDAADIHEREQARAGGLLEDGESVFGEDAVLAEQRDKVGDGAHRDEVEVVAQPDRVRLRMVRLAHRLEQRVHELEDEADGAEVLPGRRGRLGVDVRVDEDRLLRHGLL